MLIQEMTDRECRAVLAGKNVARLACALNNQPYIVPIHVDFHDQFLYGYATLGLKIEWMRQNPLVCVEVDDVKSQTQWTSVIVLGQYEELPDIPHNEAARRIAEHLFQKHPMWWEPASVPVAGQQQRHPILFRIGIVRVTGRRAGQEALETGSNASDAERPGWLARIRRHSIIRG